MLKHSDNINTDKKYFEICIKSQKSRTYTSWNRSFWRSRKTGKRRKKDGVKTDKQRKQRIPHIHPLYGWMDGRMVGRMVGPMVGWTDGWTDGWI